MKRIGLMALMLLGLLTPIEAKSKWGIAYRWSVAALATGVAADTGSSWGGIEANPALGRGQRFGGRMAGIKLGAMGAAIGLEIIARRRHGGESLDKPLTIVNFGLAGLTGATAVRNVRTRSAR